MIMLIRHAEKPLHPTSSPHGVNPDGQADPHSLTVKGWIRAGALVELFAPSRGDSPAELRRPDTIYASAHAGGHSKRSLQTVGPLAARLGLEVVKRYAAGDEAHLARDQEPPRRHLVAWHHEASTQSSTTWATCTRDRPTTGRPTGSTSSDLHPGRPRVAPPKSRNSCPDLPYPIPARRPGQELTIGIMR